MYFRALNGKNSPKIANYPPIFAVAGLRERHRHLALLSRLLGGWKSNRAPPDFSASLGSVPLLTAEVTVAALFPRAVQTNTHLTAHNFSRIIAAAPAQRIIETCGAMSDS
jgi:hypothetical protein